MARWRRLLWLTAGLCLVTGAAGASPLLAAPEYPEFRKPVVDDAGAVPDEEERALDRSLLEYQNKSGNQVAVAVVRTTGGARAYAEGLFLASGLHERPAVLLLAAPGVRRVEVVTAPDVRGRVTDADCAKAVEVMTAFFARGDYAGGIVAGVKHLSEVAGPGRAAPGATELHDVLGD